MPTPLESFMEALQKGHKCEESLKSRNFTHTPKSFSAPEAKMKCELTLPDGLDAPPVFSHPAHTHTLRGFDNAGAEMKGETKCEGSLTLGDPLQVGMIVEWESPVVGLLAGVVLEITPHAVMVFHPLTEREVPIPRSWLRVTAR